MFSFLQAFLMVVGVAALVLGSVLIGGFIVFRCKSGPGERFIGREPKGAAFTIPDPASDVVDGEQDKRLAGRIEDCKSKIEEMLFGGKG